MPLVFTPGQLSRKSGFYYQLGQMLAAGITLPAALEQLWLHPPARSFRGPIQRIRDDLHAGATFAEALQRADWVPEFDLALLSAGEQSGRLDQSTRLLADYYGDAARTARQVIGDLAYPVALFHFAVFIFPFATFFLSGNWVDYLSKTLGILLPIYAVVVIGVFMCQGSHGEVWRALLERLLGMVPVLGSARRSLALARLCAALEGLLSAGVSIIQAWELAGAASGSPRLKKTISNWRPQVDGGMTPAEVVTASRQFPPIFVGQYSAGEVSGTLEETLMRLHRYFQDEGSRKLHAFAQWTPRGIYLGIVLMIAVKVVSFWIDYFGKIQEAINF